MEAPDPTRFDNCGCFKRHEGAYGDGGFHLVKLTPDLAFRLCWNRLNSEYRDQHDGASPDLETRKQLHRQAQSMSKNYVGTRYAYEPCQSFIEARKRWLDDRAVRSGRGRGKRPTVDDDA